MSSRSSQPRRGIAAALAFFPLTGVWGADKHYVGSFGKSYSNAKTTAWVQTALAITLIGLLITIPWTWLSTLALVIAILTGGIPFLYPKVQWAPVNKTDKTIAWVIVGLFVFFTIYRFFSATKEKYQKEKKKKIKDI